MLQSDLRIEYVSTGTGSPTTTLLSCLGSASVAAATPRLPGTFLTLNVVRSSANKSCKNAPYPHPPFPSRSLRVELEGGILVDGGNSRVADFHRHGAAAFRSIAPSVPNPCARSSGSRRAGPVQPFVDEIRARGFLLIWEASGGSVDGSAKPPLPRQNPMRNRRPATPTNGCRSAPQTHLPVKPRPWT